MKINRYIDHTILKPEATDEQVVQLCEEALKHEFASVCVNPCFVPLVGRTLKLKGIDVKTCSVIGFPLGANEPLTKAFEAGFAIVNGAGEVDMVINIGALKSGNMKKVAEDISAVVKVASGKVLVKVIIECCLLSDEEKTAVCQIAVNEGANFVKTSTGFGWGGATVEDVKLMRKTVGPGIGVKASGGIRDYLTAMKMIEAGADRIGTSYGIAIMEQAKKQGDLKP